MKFLYLLALLLFTCKSFAVQSLSALVNNLNKPEKYIQISALKNRQKDPVLLVTGVRVSLSDKNSLLAKKKSLLGAMRRAFNRISRSEFGFINLEDISDDEISNSLKEYSIENEKFSANFYSAKMSFSFFRKNIAEILKRHGANIEEEELYEQAKQKKLIIYLRDYMHNFKELSKLVLQITNCFNDTVTLLIDDSQFENFLNLNIRYVDL